MVNKVKYYSVKIHVTACTNHHIRHLFAAFHQSSHMYCVAQHTQAWLGPLSGGQNRTSPVDNQQVE